MQYLKQVCFGVEEKKDELDALIEQNAVGWRLARIGKVDLSILRLALYEMRYREDVPGSVAINEAVELSKKYSEKKSRQFINGILGSVYRADKQADEKEEEA